MMFSERAQFDLAVKLRRNGAPLGEIYSFVSGLYFRGKLAYAKTFEAPPAGVPGSLVITPGHGLVPPESIVTIAQLLEMARIPIDEADQRYRAPLDRHARALSDAAGPDCDFVLLGSVATVKYLKPLCDVFGDRLLFPTEFAGRGDMSRGGLMLRCARGREELTYIPVGSGTRHGPRPPKLPKLKRY